MFGITNDHMDVTRVRVVYWTERIRQVLFRVYLVMWILVLGDFCYFLYRYNEGLENHRNPFVPLVVLFLLFFVMKRIIRLRRIPKV